MSLSISKYMLSNSPGFFLIKQILSLETRAHRLFSLILRIVE